jgi:hypothetical protein
MYKKTKKIKKKTKKPKKPKKKQKTKITHWAGFFFKKPGFFPTLVCSPGRWVCSPGR